MVRVSDPLSFSVQKAVSLIATHIWHAEGQDCHILLADARDELEGPSSAAIYMLLNKHIPDTDAASKISL